MLRDIFSLNENDPILDKKFRKKQIWEFIFKKKIFSFDLMKNLPLALRERLNASFSILGLEEQRRQKASDGTVKFLFRLSDDSSVEAVLLEDKNSNYTFCISTQCGCRMGCTFCKTGEMGLIRDLTPAEIVSQILFIAGYLQEKHDIGEKKFNIVFMGMGEPLDNFDNLLAAIRLIIAKDGFALSPQRITVSTCGVAAKIPPLLEEVPSIGLAVSLNSAIESKRSSIMPITRKYPLKELAAVLTDCFERFHNRITLEYVLIKGFNMGEEDIEALKMFNSKAFHINIIPLNRSEAEAERPSEAEIKFFITRLEQMNFRVSRRYRRGDEIQAACGQLYWEEMKE